MPNGDLVTACSDGVARIFSKASERQAPAETVAAFHTSIEDRKQQAKQGELSNLVAASDLQHCSSRELGVPGSLCSHSRLLYPQKGAADPSPAGCVVMVGALQQAALQGCCMPAAGASGLHSSCPVGPLHICVYAAAAANEGVPPGLNVEEPSALAQPGQDGQMKFIRESTGVNYYSWSSQT